MKKDSSAARLASWLRDRGPRARGPATGCRPPARWSTPHGVSPVTVSRVLAALGAEGLVVSRPGAGTFARQPPGRRAGADYSWQTLALADRTIDAAGLSPLADPPARRRRHLAGHRLPAPVADADPGARRGAGPRRPPARRLGPAARCRACTACAPGSPSAAGPGRRRPRRPGHRAAARARSRPRSAPWSRRAPRCWSSRPPTPAPWPSPGPRASARCRCPPTRDGVIPELLADAFARTGAQAFYCQPAYAQPDRRGAGGPRRAAVLAAAAGRGRVRHRGRLRAAGCARPRPPPPLLADDGDGRVVLVTSLTKAASPSLRVGALIARGPVAARLRGPPRRGRHVRARPVQEAALDLVSRPPGTGTCATSAAPWPAAPGPGQAAGPRALPARRRRAARRRHAPVGPAAGRPGRRRGRPRPPAAA